MSDRRLLFELPSFVRKGTLYFYFTSFTSACGNIVRISKIEIIGKKRRNRNSKLMKRPIVPKNIPKSHLVG